MKRKSIADWEKVADNGFGNKHNICIWSMKRYKDYLYVGTLNYHDGCQIFRSPNGDQDSWKQVNINGFDKNNISAGARTMIVHDNLLWVIASLGKNGAQIWVTNGKTSDKEGKIVWKKANLDGFGQKEKIKGSRALSVFKNKLHVGTQLKNDIPRVYRYEGSTDFNKIQQDKWSWINQEWDNDLYYLSKYSLIGKFQSFKTKNNKEYLLAGVYSEPAPLVYQLKKSLKPLVFFKLIKFFFTPEIIIFLYDGKKWRKSSKKGFGKSNILVMSSTEFNNSIYFGTSHVLGGEIWKSDDGFKWKQIMKRGLSNPFNMSVWSLFSYNDNLIVGTQNIALGCQIWMSKNKNPNSNKDFIQIARSGMNKKTQYNPLKFKQDGIRTFESFKNQLYAGTGSFMNILFFEKIGPGCEIWRKKINY